MKARVLPSLADPSRWPSLADQRALAERMFGECGGVMIADWLAGETGRIDDLAFAKLFTDQVSLPGIADADYTHRHIRTKHGELIGGIRFYGQDTSRPFVEVVAHAFDDLDALRDCARSAWKAFKPHDLRTRALPGSFRCPGARTDVTIHAARHRDMDAPDGRVRLEPFVDAEEAIAMVRRRYERVAAVDPTLAANISAADPDDMRAWHTAGQLRAIVAREADERVGLLAIAPGQVAWIEGDEVNEIGVEAHYNGHGYAASA